jgi:hypothetical protein
MDFPICTQSSYPDFKLLSDTQGGRGGIKIWIFTQSSYPDFKLSVTTVYAACNRGYLAARVFLRLGKGFNTQVVTLWCFNIVRCARF